MSVGEDADRDRTKSGRRRLFIHSVLLPPICMMFCSPVQGLCRWRCGGGGGKADVDGAGGMFPNIRFGGVWVGGNSRSGS